MTPRLFLVAIAPDSQNNAFLDLEETLARAAADTTAFLVAPHVVDPAEALKSALVAGAARRAKTDEDEADGFIDFAITFEEALDDLDEKELEAVGLTRIEVPESHRLAVAPNLTGFVANGVVDFMGGLDVDMGDRTADGDDEDDAKADES